MRAELVEHRASIAQGTGGHGVGPVTPTPVAAQVGEGGSVSIEVQQVLPHLIGRLSVQSWRGCGATQRC